MFKSMNKNFAILLSGQLVSQIGDKFYMLALSFWVLQITGSSTKMGMALAAALIPSFVLGFVSGTFIDRYNRKLIIAGTDFFRGAIISVVVVLYYMGALNFYIIIISQVLLSINSAFFDPAISAVIPQIVNEDDITTANSKHQFVQGISTIIGPVLGGIAVASFGYLFIFIVNAASFFISGIFEMFMQIPQMQDNRLDDVETGSNHPKIISEMKQGYRYIFANRALMILLMMVGVIHFFVGSIEVIMPMLASSLSIPGAEEGAKNLGFFQACFGCGAIVMATVLSFKAINGKESKVLFGSVFLIGVLYILAAVPSQFSRIQAYLYFPIFLLNGCFVISAFTAFKSLLQKRVDNRLAGRVFGVVGSIGNGSIPVAMIIYGFLLDKFSFNNLLLISGLILFPLSLISYVLFQGADYAQKTKSSKYSNSAQNISSDCAYANRSSD